MMMVVMPVRSQSSHWSCNIHAYQYDMTVYLQLKIGNIVLTDYSDYEVAAFCAEECRGVSTALTTNPSGESTSVLRIRVRSNNTNGDKISFKVYQKSVDKETQLADIVTFESLAVIGLPSEPLTLQFSDILLGDANNDGKVSITDAVCIVNKILGNPPSVFREDLADYNLDGKVSITDAVAIVNKILGEETDDDTEPE